MGNREKHEFKLLVEGKDDQHVMWSLCEYHHLKENFDVIDCGSIENVKGQLELRITEESSRNKRVGIIIDADLNIQQRWDSIKSILTISKKYTVPADLPNEGLILTPIETDEPTIGVWIYPQSKSTYPYAYGMARRPRNAYGIGNNKEVS